MKINKDTVKLFSVASRPGNFGARMYNELFKLLGINAIYVPLGVDPKHGFDKAFHGLEIVGARGINVSMPFKNDARQHVCNSPDYSNVNTLVRDTDDTWHGYNSDAHGFITALQTVVPVAEIEKVHIFGCGAVASTATEALHAIKSKMLITADKDPPRSAVDLLVNATPVGMEGVEVRVPWDRFVSRAKYVFDAVISPPKLPTELIKTAREQRKPYVEGHSMCEYGLAHQFLWHFPHQRIAQVRLLIRGEMKVMGYDV